MTERLCGLTFKGSEYASRPEMADMINLPDHKLRQVGVGLLWGSVDRECYKPWVKDYTNYCIKHQYSKVYDVLYQMLDAMGYVPTDEEEAYLAGAHEVYTPFEEVEG